MRRFACGMLTLAVSFGVIGCGADPNPPGLPSDAKPEDPAKSEARQKQFMQNNIMPKKKPR